MEKNIAVIWGDCSSPEIVKQTIRVLDKVAEKYGHTFHYTDAAMGGEAIDKYGDPLPQHELDKCLAADSVLLGAVGGIIAGLGGGNIVPVAIGVALKCLGSSPACYLILAMIADVIDHIEYRTGIRTDGLTMSIYSSLMVAATPICNSIFSAMLNGSGYNQAADVALGTAAQTASVQTAISVSYIWVETVCYIIGAVILILFWTVEKNLPEEQKAIKERSKK